MSQMVGLQLVRKASSLARRKVGTFVPWRRSRSGVSIVSSPAVVVAGSFREENTFPVLSLVGAGVILTLCSAGYDDRQGRTQLEASAVAAEPPLDLQDADDSDDSTLVINWSGTHSVNVKNDNYWEPETIEEVESIIKKCHEKGQAVRPLGSSLSPNGIGLNGAGMMSMANLDEVIAIDKENMTVTVQAGITVNNVSVPMSWLYVVLHTRYFKSQRECAYHTYYIL